jgi:hypothetical protein
MPSTNDDMMEVRKDQIPFDIFAITSFICTIFYVSLYSILITPKSFPLTSFPFRVIGISVLEGIDVSARTHLYLYSLILTGIIAVVLLIYLEKMMNQIIPSVHYEKERFFLALMSIFGTANLIFTILTQNSVFLFNIYLIVCLLCCIITLIAAKKYAEIKHLPNFQLFGDLPLIITIFLIPVPLIFMLLVIEGGAFIFTFSTFVEYYLLYSVLLFALTGLCIDKFPRIRDAKFRGILVTSAVPLYFYPVSIPLTNELQYTLSQWFSFDPRILSLVVFILLFLISCLLYWRQTQQNRQFFDSQFSLNNLSLPALLAAVSLYANYLASAPFASIEYRGNLFEFGMTSTVVQQFFDFGKIPLVNLATPHGIMDIYYPILYSFVNGYRPFDCFLWQWITPMLIVLTGYFFLKEFLEGHVAGLLIIFLPLFGILNFNDFPGTSECFILIAGIFFIRFWKDPQLKNYCILMISILFCFVWSAEAGVASLLAFILITIILYFRLLKKSPRQLWTDYSGYLFATIGLLGLCVAIYVILCLITHISPISSLKSVANMYIQNDPAGTYPDIFKTYNAQVALEYAIFPLISLGLILGFIWIALTKRVSISAQLILLTFLAIATLFLSQRGVQRHSLIEIFALYYFPLLACSIPLLWYRSQRYISIIFVILILTAGSFVAHYPLTPVQNDLSNNFFEFKTWISHETRVLVQERDISQVAKLTDYLGDNLHANETYFDMSQYLMPYTLLRKEYMSDTVISPAAGEWHQDETIHILNQNIDRIPIVVTGQIGNPVPNDGVPYELRDYRISEYVYLHYRPIGYIDNYEIWLRNDFNSSSYGFFSNPSDPIPITTGNLVLHDILLKNESAGINLQTGSNYPYITYLIPNDSPVQLLDSKDTGIHLIYSSDTSGPVLMYYSVNSSPYSVEHSIVGTIQAGNMDQDFYAVIPSNIHYITNISFILPDNSNINLKRGYIYPQNSPLIPDETFYHNFNLEKLPYIWGTFDTSDPALHQPVQDILFDGNTQITPNVPVLFSNITSTLDKTSGNYILISLNSERGGTIRVDYGDSKNGVLEKPATISFNTIPSDETQNYLIRVSAQWNWYAQPVTDIQLTASVPVTLEKCEILKGD